MTISDKSAKSTPKYPPKTPTKAKSSGVADGVKEERCTLVLQGGGALGAYQAGVYEAMQAHGLQPTWVAGVSIGAINAAIIAGNPPERRVERLGEFWDGVSSYLKFFDLPKGLGNQAREMLNESRAAMVSLFGVPGFFTPRMPPAPMHMPGTIGALSYYDTTPLQHTLEKLIDFDLLNTQDPRHKVRLSVGAVNVSTGNFRYFDSAAPGKDGLIGPHHIMASGALPPGFPPVEIDGEFYWDGGLVSNTPLQYVIDQPRAHDMLVLQVDLFSARGRMPRNLSEVTEREKDIRFASRTRLNTDVVAQQQLMGAAARRLAAKLPAELADDPDLAQLVAVGSPAALTILHLIHRDKHYETQSKDYEFSRQTMREHWAAGRAAVQTSLASPQWAARSKAPAGINVLDLTPPAKIRNQKKEPQ